MIGRPADITIWLYCKPADMRSSYNGLIALTLNQLNCPPDTGQFFLFINRKKTQMKVLYFEAGGYCLWCKRLEQGQFGVNFSSENPKLQISTTEFLALVEGIDMQVKRRRKRYKK